MASKWAATISWRSIFRVFVFMASPSYNSSVTDSVKPVKENAQPDYIKFWSSSVRLREIGLGALAEYFSGLHRREKDRESISLGLYRLPLRGGDHDAPPIKAWAVYFPPCGLLRGRTG
jgi:hypothetical protein